jgi:type II secretory pathway component PulL
MSELTDALLKLQQVRASGARRLRDSDGSEVEYRSDAELKAAIGYLESLKTQPIRMIRFTSSKFGVPKC